MTSRADVASDAKVALGSAELALKAAADASDAKVDAEQAALTAAKKAREAKPPPPDPRDGPHFEVLRRAEGWAAAAMNPRRSRWPELQRIDERRAEIDAKQGEATAALNELQQRRPHAEPEHQARVADWIANGQQGPRPVSDADAIDNQIGEISAEVAAWDITRERTLAERVAFVDKHRKRLLKEAQTEKERRLARCLALVDELEREREELSATRQTELWAALYPHDSLASDPPFTNCLAGARLSIQERHLPGVTNQLIARNVFGLLRDDAQHCASVATTEQAAAISGTSPATMTGKDAEWQDRKFETDQQRRENQAAIERYIKEWGIVPSEWA